MRSVLFIAIAFAFLASCKKVTNITNNYPTSHKPAFTVQGLTDLTMSLGHPSAVSSFVVTFEDSVSEKVNLEVSGLPAGVTVPFPWVQSGYPTFASQIGLAEGDTLHPALPGTYPLTLSCKGVVSGTRLFKFNLTVEQNPLYTGFISGNYSNCTISSASAPVFSSTVQDDSFIHNRITITNFANTGLTVVGAVYTNGTEIYNICIPRQTVDTFTFVGSGTFNTSTTRQFYLNMKINNQTKTLNFK